MWGGGGGFGGGPMMGTAPGRRGAVWGTAPGTQFAGIPPEMVERVQSLLDREPEYQLQDVPFTQVVDETEKPFSLGRLLRPKRWPILGVLILVAFEAFALQYGPRLVADAIDQGINPQPPGTPTNFTIVWQLAGVRGPVGRGHGRRRDPHRVVGAYRRGRALRPPEPRLQPHPAALARLLHGREGGSHHDPRHERHRGHPDAVPAGPHQHVAPGLHARRGRVADVLDEHHARALRGVRRRSHDDDPHDLVPLAVRLRLPRGARLDRALDVRSPGEPLGHACRGGAQPAGATTG